MNTTATLLLNLVLLAGAAAQDGPRDPTAPAPAPRPKPRPRWRAT